MQDPQPEPTDRTVSLAAHAQQHSTVSLAALAQQHSTSLNPKESSEVSFSECPGEQLSSEIVRNIDPGLSKAVLTGQGPTSQTTLGGQDCRPVCHPDTKAPVFHQTPTGAGTTAPGLSSLATQLSQYSEEHSKTPVLAGQGPTSSLEMTQGSIFSQVKGSVNVAGKVPPGFASLGSSPARAATLSLLYGSSNKAAPPPGFTVRPTVDLAELASRHPSRPASEASRTPAMADSRSRAGPDSKHQKIPPYFSISAQPSIFGRALCCQNCHGSKLLSEQKPKKNFLYPKFSYVRQISTKFGAPTVPENRVRPFDFTTPSPDDIVRDRQRGAFTRTGDSKYPRVFVDYHWLVV